MVTRNAAAPGGVANYYNVEAGWEVVAGGATVTLYLDPPVGVGEIETMVALIEVRKVGAPGVNGNITVKGQVENVAGTLTNGITGSTSTLYTDVSTPAGANLNAALAGTSGAIVASGGGLAVQVTAPGGVPIYARANIDISRGQKPPAVALSVSPTMALTAGGTTITLTGEGFASGVVYVTLSSGISGPQPIKPTIVSDTSLTFVAPAWVAGTFDVGLVRSDGTYVLAGALTYSSVLPPTLTALTNPLLAPAAGGGTAVTLQGTNLASVTTVTVGSATVTPSGTTSTSVTFTWPANTASATAYGINVTNGAGTSNTLASAVYYLPSSITYAWYAGQGFNAGTGAWTDLIGGVATALSGGSVPTLNQTFHNGNPAITFSGGGGLQGTFTALSMPGSVFFLGNTSTAASNTYLFDSNDTAHRWAALWGGNTSHTLLMTEGTNSPSNALNGSMATGYMWECNFNGASSFSSADNGTQTGMTLTTATMHGVTIGARFDGTQGWVGNVGWCLIAGAGAPSAGDRTVIMGIQTALWAL